jgi:hypothetical protein
VISLLHYTKKLYDKIRFYDKLAEKPSENPFAKPINITIVWVEQEKG